MAKPAKYFWEKGLMGEVKMIEWEESGDTTRSAEVFRKRYRK
jgi:hypothetical protein